MTEARLHGLLASFDSSEALLHATRAAREAGYRRLDAFTPFPVEGLAQALAVDASPLPWIMLAGALVGGAFGFGLPWYSSVIDYPLNIGGRPLNAWPAFIVIAFEMTILGGALAGLFGMLALNGLPRLHHPLFAARAFQLASRNRFFLLVLADDPLFEPAHTHAFLRRLEPLVVEEVAP